AFFATPVGIPVISQVIDIVTKIGQGVSREAVAIANALVHVVRNAWPWSDPTGSVHANEDRIGDEETFTLVALEGGKVGILTFRGYLSARHDLDGRVWAHDGGLAAWETWGFVRNPDNTVSFSSDQNWFMFTHPDRSKEIWTDSQSVQGDGEKFDLQLVGNG